MGFEYKSNRAACEQFIVQLARSNLEKACVHLTNETKKTLTGQRHGRVYRVVGTKHAYYTASAPGEPPAVRTGRLRNSIKYVIVGGGLRLLGRVGTSLDYAPHLEFGTRNMAPRPFLMPTYEKERLKLKRILGGG
jgi:HK97 gp10 family phage protein